MKKLLILALIISFGGISYFLWAANKPCSQAIITCNDGTKHIRDCKYTTDPAKPTQGSCKVDGRISLDTAARAACAQHGGVATKRGCESTKILPF